MQPLLLFPRNGLIHVSFAVAILSATPPLGVAVPSIALLRAPETRETTSNERDGLRIEMLCWHTRGSGVVGVRKQVSLPIDRDGVIAIFPDLEPRKKELTSVADEADGIAIAVVGCGFSVGKAKGKNPRRRKKSARV